MQTIFAQISHPQLKGTLVWEPMLAEDDFAAAITQQKVFWDSRIQHYWDPDRSLGKLVAERLLKNTPIAWNIYLLYQPGTHWVSEKFPAPNFWMHQLSEDNSLRLNPEVLHQRVLEALNTLQNKQPERK